MGKYEKISQIDNKSSNKVTLKMIAEKAGVSVSCVTRCRVLAGNLDVKQMQIWMSNLEKIPERKARE